MVQIRKFADANSVAAGAADSALDLIIETLQDQPEFHLMVTGGTVGIATLAEIAKNPKCALVDFRRVHFWWGDERFVASGHADRNDQQAQDALLSKIETDESKVHRFPSADAGLTLEQAVLAFDAELAASTAPDERLPRFDLVFLGMGPDGHVASLFPGKPEPERNALVIAEHDSPKPPPQRLSFSFEALNSASRIWFTVAGPDKAAAVAVACGPKPEQLPAGRVRGRGATVWFLDDAAAAGLAA